MRLIGLLLILAQAAFAVAQADEDWIQRADISHPIGNLAFRTQYRPADGLHFKIVSGDSKKSVVISLNRKKGDIRLAPEKAFSPAVIQGSQFHLDALPTNQLDNIEVILKFRPELWAVYVQDRPVAVVPRPFLPPTALLVPFSELPPDEQIGTRFQKTDGFYFNDNFLVAEEEEVKLAQWETESGWWRLHSVKESAKVRGGMDAERSPNFYALLGKGTNAVITAGHSFYDSYSLEAAVQVTPGEMGLVFFRQDLHRYHAFTIRMEKDSNRVLLTLWQAGPGAAQGRKIIGAVSSEITHGQWVKLGVTTFQNRVKCYVDSTKVIDVPVELPSGGTFGLYASSENGVRFDDVIAKSNRDLDFRGVSDLRRHVVAEDVKAKDQGVGCP